MRFQRDLLAGVLGISFSLLLPVSSAAADRHTIGTIMVKGLYSADRNELLGMMELREGAVIDAQRVQTGIKRAFLKGIFEDISVETNDQEPAAVTVSVRERDIIGKISFHGDCAVSSKRLRSLLMIKDGEVVRTDLIAEAERDLKDKLSLAGYPHAVVHISWERMKEPYRTEMLLLIADPNPGCAQPE